MTEIARYPSPPLRDPSRAPMTKNLAQLTTLGLPTKFGSQNKPSTLHKPQPLTKAKQAAPSSSLKTSSLSTGSFQWPTEISSLYEKDPIDWVNGGKLKSGAEEKGYTALNEGGPSSSKLLNGQGTAMGQKTSLVSYDAPAPIHPSPKISTKRARPEDDDAETPPAKQARLDLYPHEVSMVWPKEFARKRRASGLRNLGNSCFINSVLQVWLHTPPFLNHFQSFDGLDEPLLNPKASSPFSLARALHMCINYSWMKNVPCYGPTVIFSNVERICPSMSKGDQEDAHEFLRYMMDRLQNDSLKKMNAQKSPDAVKESTWVHKIWGGKLRSRVTCHTCKHNSDTVDAFLDLSLDIGGGIDSLERALQEFTKADKLTGKNQYKCEKCNKLVDATKKFSILEAPPVLSIHLKRFKPGGGKITSPVQYPTELRIDPFTPGIEKAYDLYAVTCHSGGGPHWGHYYSFVKNLDGNWLEMNDEEVLHAGKRYQNHSKAYMLHYMERPATKPDSKPQEKGKSEAHTSSPRSPAGRPSSPLLFSPTKSLLNVNVKPLVNGNGAPSPMSTKHLNAEAGPSRILPTPVVRSVHNMKRSAEDIGERIDRGQMLPPPVPAHAYQSQSSNKPKFAPIKDQTFYGGASQSVNTSVPEANDEAEPIDDDDAPDPNGTSWAGSYVPNERTINGDHSQHRNAQHHKYLSGGPDRHKRHHHHGSGVHGNRSPFHFGGREQDPTRGHSQKRDVSKDGQRFGGGRGKHNHHAHGGGNRGGSGGRNRS